MSENLPDIEEVFFNSIEEHQEMPAASLWDNIDHQLDKNAISIANKKYRILLRLSAALLLLFLGTLAYELHRSNKPDNHAVDQSSKLVKTKLQPDGDASKLHTPAEAAGSSVKPNGTVEHSQAEGSLTEQAAHNTTIENSNNSLETSKDKMVTTKPSYTYYNKNAVDSLKANDNNKKLMVWSNKQNAGKKKLASKDDSAYKNKRQRLRSQYIDKNASDTNSNSIADPFYELKKTPTENSDAIDTTGAQQPASFRDNRARHMNNTVLSEFNYIIKPLTAANIGREANRLLPEMSGLNIDMRGSKPAIQTGYTAPIPVLVKTKKSVHVGLMPFVSSQFGFDRIMDDDHHGGGSQGRNEREDIKRDESEQLSYNTGIVVNIPLKKRWSLQTGLVYISKSLEIEPKKIYAQLNNSGNVQYRLDCSCGFTYLSPKTGTPPAVGDSIFTTGSSSRLQYIGIPLSVNYRMLNGKFNIIPSIGTMVNFLIKQQIATGITGTTTSQQNYTSLQGLNKIYITAVAGAALQYNASKRISVDLIPSFNVAVSSINQSAIVKSFPNSFNIAAGIMIQL